MLDFLVLGLAVTRLYILLAYDNGPMNIFVRFRHWAGVRPYDKPPGFISTNSFARGLMCEYCSTIWYALFFTVCYLLNPAYTLAVAWVLALSMLAVLIIHTHDRINS